MIIRCLHDRMGANSAVTNGFTSFFLHRVLVQASIVYSNRLFIVSKKLVRLYHSGLRLLGVKSLMSYFIVHFLFI